MSVASTPRLATSSVPIAAPKLVTPTLPMSPLPTLATRASLESVVRQSSQNRRHLSVVKPTDVAEATCAFLRRQHPAKTAEAVAADLAPFRIKAGTIGKMLERRSAPSARTLLALTCAYGPEFLAEVLPTPPAWLDASWRAQRQEAFIREAAALQRRYEDCK